jgi:VanZ family protein
VAPDDPRLDTARLAGATRYALATGYAAFLLSASVVEPGGGDPMSPLFGLPADKVLHVGSYAVLAVLVAFAMRAGGRRALALVAVIAVGYGAAIELLQAPIPWRTLDALDATANAAGALLGVAAWTAIVGLVRWMGARRAGRREAADRLR